MIATWLVALGTIVLAIVAVFQETIRSWFYRPKFRVSAKTEPPDCVAVPFTDREGTFIADSFYLRIWVENVGNAAARNVEVFASRLRLKRLDEAWETVATFPSMNLKWAHLGGIYFPSIAPQMGKHCDVGHITDPSRRHLLREDAPKLGLTDQQSSLAFDLMAAPNNRSHIVGPGEYELDIMITAENSVPTKRTIVISLRGTWDTDEIKMFRDGVGLRVVV